VAFRAAWQASAADESKPLQPGANSLPAFFCRRAIRRTKGAKDSADLGCLFVLRFQQGNSTCTGLLVPSRILVVDDCQYVADASARLIAVCGYETKAVYDGQEAIAQLIAFSPDMVLMDIGMPDLDGWETALRIRREPAGANIFLVAVTCFSQEQDRQRTYASGFDLHVAKPISLTTLHGLLATLYQRKESANRAPLLPTDVVSR